MIHSYILQKQPYKKANASLLVNIPNIILFVECNNTKKYNKM